jgi:hypothetical protein
MDDSVVDDVDDGDDDSAAWAGVFSLLLLLGKD